MCYYIHKSLSRLSIKRKAIFIFNTIEDHNANPLGLSLVDQVQGFWRAKNVVWVQVEDESRDTCSHWARGFWNVVVLVTLTKSPRVPGLPPPFTNSSLPILARSTHWKLWVFIIYFFNRKRNILQIWEQSVISPN